MENYMNMKNNIFDMSNKYNTPKLINITRKYH